jgi:hypothetical protein
VEMSEGHGGSAAAGGAMQPGVSLLSAEAADAEFGDPASSDEWHAARESLEERGSALHGSAGVSSVGASCEGGHVGDQLVQGELIEEERDGWGGEGGEQHVDAVERPGGWPASLKVRPSCPARTCCDPDAAPETDDNGK